MGIIDNGGQDMERTYWEITRSLISDKELETLESFCYTCGNTETEITQYCSKCKHETSFVTKEDL